MTLEQRFLKYVAFDTQSDPKSETYPSTAKQLALLNHLLEEMTTLGLHDVEIDPNGYVTGTIPATPGCESAPVVGFISHVDTSPDMKGSDIRPGIIERYDGGDIALNDKLTMRAADFPELAFYKGHRLIVTDGTTLLGADDKAGVAEIMEAVEKIQANPSLKHGKIGIAFTPDEEIGEGASLFDVKGFGCDFAYTVDGEELGELGYETFNAAEATITLKGKNIHPGAAKGKMVNCALLAGEVLAALPSEETPATTEGREGFYHVESVRAEVESGEIKLIIRDHDMKKFQAKKAHILSIGEKLNKKYGAGSAEVKIRDQYFNCIEKIRPHFHLIENARTAFQKEGISPIEAPVRGGTDGCTLSFMGLPCPNLSTGGLNAHSVLEFIPVPAMEKMVKVIINLVEIYGTGRKEKP